MTPYKDEISTEREANLRKLAAKLLAVSESEFDMAFFSDNDEPCDPVRCGTVGCAVGWGPAAGIEASVNDDNWWNYSYRVFVPSDDVEAWDWCFDADWASVDNTPSGAALRILYLLDKGLPEDSYEQMYGSEPLCYREVAE